jgi:decaprenylphospho-beta-D-ribofuranose 2-oxidase
MRWKNFELKPWGRVCRAPTTAARPERLSEIAPIVRENHSNGLSVYAAGRSYGDSALNSNGQNCLSERLDRILAFDESTGVVDVEPGVNFRKLMNVFLPKGWLVPVSPGTSFATIGGAVAHDVHGKNHEREGSFGQHVSELDLVTANGVSHRIGPQSRADWFRATCGGCGLTGVITRVAFKMRRVPSAFVEAKERRLENLDGFFAAFEAAKGASYSVGWIDALARGAALGRGILETAEPAAEAGFVWRKKHAASVPVDFPAMALNALSVKAFNSFYIRRVPKSGRQRLRAYEDFFYPLDAIEQWNRIYGRRGFHQFQCVVPCREGEKAIRRLLETIAASQSASPLTVLKRLGPGRAGYLSFPMEGYTLALDFPNRAATEALYRALAGVTLEHGGRIYLAKDALLWAEAMPPMYPELGEFQRVLEEIDPDARFQSDMSRRLHLRARA